MQNSPLSCALTAHFFLVWIFHLSSLPATRSILHRCPFLWKHQPLPQSHVRAQLVCLSSVHDAPGPSFPTHCLLCQWKHHGWRGARVRRSVFFFFFFFLLVHHVSCCRESLGDVLSLTDAGIFISIDIWELNKSTMTRCDAYPNTI